MILFCPQFVDADSSSGLLLPRHFEVNAKVDDATAAQLQKVTRHEQNQQMDLMLRSLLIDRFKLKVRRETKDEQVFALVIAKGGPKFKETTGVKGQGGPSFQNGLSNSNFDRRSDRHFCGGAFGSTRAACTLPDRTHRQI